MTTALSNLAIMMISNLWETLVWVTKRKHISLTIRMKNVSFSDYWSLVINIVYISKMPFRFGGWYRGTASISFAEGLVESNFLIEETVHSLSQITLTGQLQRLVHWIMKHISYISIPYIIIETYNNKWLIIRYNIFFFYLS